ncbi:MAG: hypothetical protein COZ85_03140 [Candidatus Moranbacteria bacterium CG_4_8_14_3_um_filter_34_16]|nr:MAG: hypothetical protein COT31_01415 [Candidatus Moranbacteria bacterium CG08_land_8_20_14_0_20_34_16]PIW94825.1 MAG: hypothetical protein COZ85_03140 [Candidatus Moranbacteria bacterium CG_4_8_14_3_um_filter_34_16]
MKEIFKTKSFWTIFLLASFVITSAFFNLEKIFQSEIDFLIIPQNEVSVKNSPQIISNLSALPATLSFFGEIIRENPDLFNEGIGEFPDDKKKQYWNKKIKIENFKETGIIRITLNDKDRFQLEDLADQVKETFIKSVGIYYDIKKDIDVRLIEEPIVQDAFAQPFWIIILKGFLTGFLISFLSFYFSFSFLKKNQKNEKKQTKKDYFQSNFNQNKKSFFELKPNKNEIGKKKFTESKIKPWILAETTGEENYFSGFSKKWMAPDNLPVAPEEPKKEDEKKEELIFSVPKSKHLFSQNFPNENLPKHKDKTKEDLLPTKMSEENETEELEFREPTLEEVKERLNKLLSGKKI